MAEVPTATLAQDLLLRRHMPIRSLLRAPLCQWVATSVIAITFAGCGGVIATPSSDRSSSPDASLPDASSPDARGAGCPSLADIDSKAAVGKACAPDGTFCLDPACDPCNQDCPAITCTNGIWKTAINTATCIDASPPPCPEIDGSGFDQSCQSDSDCVAVVAGSLCPGGPQCLCAADAINVRDQSRYEAELQSLESQYPASGGVACMCPAFGSPRCVGHRCVLCGGASGYSSCPDGG